MRRLWHGSALGKTVQHADLCCSRCGAGLRPFLVESDAKNAAAFALVDEFLLQLVPFLDEPHHGAGIGPVSCMGVLLRFGLCLPLQAYDCTAKPRHLQPGLPQLDFTRTLTRLRSTSSRATSRQRHTTQGRTDEE